MLDNFYRGDNGIYLPQNVRNQLENDFRSTYFQLIGSSVNQWYSRYNDPNNFQMFINNSWQQQQAIQRMQKLQVRELAGRTEGVGDVLAIKLSNYGVNPIHVSNDIHNAASAITEGNFQSMLQGARKLGYWSGFSMAVFRYGL